jgi:hypothetical protein
VDIFYTRTQTAETLPINGSAYGSSATNVYEAITELLAQSNAGPVRVEYRELTAEEAQNNRLYLQTQPSNTDQVGLDVLDGVPQRIGHDFTVSGNVVDWSQGDLAGLLEEGEILRLIYSTIPEFRILYFELSQSDIEAAAITLPTRAFYPNQVALDVIGGVYQINGIDFICDGVNVSWSGSELEDLLEAGDTIRISFLG